MAHRECFATARCIAEALRNREAPPTASITQLSPSDESSKTEAKGKSTALTGKTQSTERHDIVIGLFVNRFEFGMEV